MRQQSFVNERKALAQTVAHAMNNWRISALQRTARQAAALALLIGITIGSFVTYRFVAHLPGSMAPASPPRTTMVNSIGASMKGGRAKRARPPIVPPGTRRVVPPPPYASTLTAPPAGIESALMRHVGFARQRRQTDA
jgi:hypothetical protein